MRRIFCLLLGCSLGGVLTTHAQVTLPIEVIGPDGYTEEVAFTLNDASEIEVLYLKAHRLAYRDASTNPGRGAKGSVRLNDGPWVDLDNSTVNCYAHEAAYGCLSGAYSTVRLTVPIPGAQTGENTLRFRFNGTDKFSSGYRILEFNLLKGQQKLLAEDSFVQDNPSDWAAPRPAAGDIAAGQVLWETAELVDYPGGPTIKATCSGCHPHDGRDLEYFAFSNWSIQERAKFHGLDQQKAEQIASYIRSLKDSKGVERLGHPWNPPYQPGPGLDNQPVATWAAGAGLEWVLEDDQEMLPYLFPEGTSETGIAAATSTRGSLNVREMPIALQLPDWQDWLPEVHPVDIWGDAFWTTDPYQAYETTRTKLANGGAQAMRTDPNLIEQRELIKNTLDPFRQSVNQFVGQGGPQPCRNNNVHSSTGFAMLGRPPAPPASDKWDDPNVCEHPLRSINHWNAIKHWEVMQEFDLEDAPADVYPYGEKRGWAGGHRQVFEMAPHRIGNDSYTFTHLNREEGSYFNTAWYQLQVTLNSGNRNPQNHRPPDWKYQMNHLYEAADNNQHPQPLRYVQTLIEMHQNLDMRQPKGFDKPAEHFPYQSDRGPIANGWWLTHVTPWRFVSVGGSFFSNNSRRFAIWDQLEAVQPGLRNKVQNALLEHWLDKTETYDVSEWPRGTGQNNVPPADAVPTPYPSSGLISSSENHHDGIYRTIPRMREAGIHEGLVERLRQWGQRMWPKGDWEALTAPPPAEDWTEELTFDKLSGTFFVAFSVLAHCDDTEGVIGLSAKQVPSDEGDLIAAIRFQENGEIVVKEGDTYRADQSFAYSVGQTYQVQFEIRIVEQQYDIQIKTRNSGAWIILASNYSLGETSSVSSLYKKTTQCDLAVSSEEFNILQVEPPVPLTIPLVASEVTDSRVTLTWTSDENDASWFVERSTDGTTYTTVASLDSQLRAYTDTTVDAATTYSYRVRVEDPIPSVSNLVTVTTQAPTTQAPPASEDPIKLPSPVDLTAKAAAGPTVMLSWSAGDSLASEYQIERKTADGNFVFIASLASSVTSYRDASVTAGTTYTYRVRAIGDAGVFPYSNEASIATEAPSFPETNASSLVSNTLTPNGDLRNDTWVINKPVSRDVWVYDRSGQLVFQQNNYQNDWAGTARGKVLEGGVYYYRVLWSDSQQSVSGYLTLIRH